VLVSWWRARKRWAVPLGGVMVALCLTAGPATAGSLPDGRAWELVSPPDKLGIDVIAESSRTHAAAGEAPGLPSAVAFTAIGGFADVQGIGIGTEYVAEREGMRGTSGWTSHGITPAQDPLPYNAITSGAEPAYQGEMSPDLTQGVFKSWSPLTDAPNVAHVPNLYVRDDLRTPGAGVFRLLTDAPSLLAPASQLIDYRVFTVGTSSNFQHVLFETKENLTADARGTNVKLYKTDGATTRLLAGVGCPGANGTRAQAPCSSSGLGLFGSHYASRVISNDGSRVAFTAPVSAIGNIQDTSGAASKLFQLDDRGTTTTADDAGIQINASEATSPQASQAATYQTSSTDGARVFFTSNEALTDAEPSGGGLYMWARQAQNEVQSVTVDATGGTFTLAAHAQPSVGSGTLASGSTEVSDVTGSFSVGQTITAPDIPAGTTIVGAPNSTTLTLSAPATADGSEQLRASVDATTTALAYNATAAQVQSALEALSIVGRGNVSVTGGPAAGTPYRMTFIGALAGVDVMGMTGDASALTGGAESVNVSTVTLVHNLTRIAAGSIVDVLGASEDGHRVYFASAGDQLVQGAPAVTERAIYLWQDADGAPGGTLSFVGGVAGTDITANADAAQWNTGPKLSRVSPDGRFMIFTVSDGSALAPGYGPSGCPVGNPNLTNTGCSQIYLYQTDGSSPTVPDLVCVSCGPSGGPFTTSAWVNIRRNASAMAFSTHLSHALSDDGRYVFFSTGDALVPEDTNGKYDAYVYDVATGQAHLLSSGTDTSDSYFMDASADGSNAYFLTRQQLVGWDTDNAYDLYDARVNGGFPEPPTPAPKCVGDACQGAPPAPPAITVLGSSTFRGAGDATAKLRARPKVARCRRGQVKRKVKGRTRCVRVTRKKKRAKVARRGTTKRRGK